MSVPPDTVLMASIKMNKFRENLHNLDTDQKLIAYFNTYKKPVTLRKYEFEFKFEQYFSTFDLACIDYLETYRIPEDLRIGSHVILYSYNGIDVYIAEVYYNVDIIQKKVTTYVDTTEPILHVKKLKERKNTIRRLNS